MYNHLTEYKHMCSGYFKIFSINYAIINHVYKEDLALNNQQGLIYHKTQPNQILYIQYMYKENLALNNL